MIGEKKEFKIRPINVVLKQDHQNKWQRDYRKKNADKLRASEKKYYHKNILKLRKQSRKSTLKIKKLVIFHYSKGKMNCSCCGELELQFLTINHKKGRKPYNHDSKFCGAKMYYWLKRNNFPKDFNVLCMNCNFAEGMFGVCPHEK